MKNYKVSIVVPVYKVEKYIHRCLESILSQTYENWEAILVDDGSPDCCPQICDEYAKKDERITVIHQENKGLSSARNMGMKSATGDILIFVDSDDWISEDALEQIVNKWNDSIELLFLDYYDTDGVTSYHRQCIGKEKVNFENDKKYTKEWLEEAICYMQKNEEYAQQLGAVWAIAFNLHVIHRNNLFFAEGTQLVEDRVYLMKVLSCVENICYYAMPVYFYFNNPKSISRLYTGTNGKTVVRILEKLDDDISVFSINDINGNKRKVYTWYVLLLVATWRATFAEKEDNKIIEAYIETLRKKIIKADMKLPSYMANIIVICSRGLGLKMIEFAVRIKEKLA